MRRVAVALIGWIFCVSSAMLPSLAHAQTVTPFLQLCMSIGNGQKLSSNGCRCLGNNDCINVCGGNISAPFCGGGVAVPSCAPVGNGVGASWNGCSCSSNLDCRNVCGGSLSNPICGGGNEPPGPPPLCRAPGSGGDLSVDGCPCDASNDCVGSCNVLTRTCGGIVGALDNVATTIAGVASNDVVFGGSIYDQATVSGGRPTPGGMFFRAFGPDDAICGTTDFFSSHPLSGMGMSMSDTLVGPAAGTWRWIASYAGNAWNLPSATMCNDVLQRVVVVPVLFADGFEQ